MYICMMCVIMEKGAPFSFRFLLPILLPGNPGLHEKRSIYVYHHQSNFTEHTLFIQWLCWKLGYFRLYAMVINMETEPAFKKMNSYNHILSPK